MDAHLCHRCGAGLTAGQGDFYVVRIEAFADPTPPRITAKDLAGENLADEIDRLIEEARDLSEQEMMDQIYRRLVITLCRKCYTRWIEDPAAT